MRQPIDVKVKQVTRVRRARGGRAPSSSVTREADNTHAKQLQVLVREVRRRVLRLEKQRIALDQTLAYLRKLELQAAVALARLAS